jgi:hypothetical protein
MRPWRFHQSIVGTGQPTIAAASLHDTHSESVAIPAMLRQAPAADRLRGLAPNSATSRARSTYPQA